MILTETLNDVVQSGGPTETVAVTLNQLSGVITVLQTCIPVL